MTDEGLVQGAPEMAARAGRCCSRKGPRRAKRISRHYWNYAIPRRLELTILDSRSRPTHLEPVMHPHSD